MACALPVISTPIGSITEAVIDGVTGLVIPPRDSAALARALTLLAGQPERRNDLGKAGLAHVRERFSLARMLDAMEAVFYNVTARA